MAFKTDKLTLTNRLELQLRQRDHAEKNIDAEISQLKKAIEVSKKKNQINTNYILTEKIIHTQVTRQA